MKTLPNGITVFNATPHELTFWQPEWSQPVIVEKDEVINADPQETKLGSGKIEKVNTKFVPQKKGWEVIARAKKAGADVIIGSIVAAQAYPGEVGSGIAAVGYERVPVPLPKDAMEALGDAASLGISISVWQKYNNLPSKRIRPDKFTFF